MTTVKINLENGDHITTRINCTPEEACNYYRIGSYINIGTVADNMQKIKSLEFIYDWNWISAWSLSASVGISPNYLHEDMRESKTLQAE